MARSFVVRPSRRDAAIRSEVATEAIDAAFVTFVAEFNWVGQSRHKHWHRSMAGLALAVVAEVLKGRLDARAAPSDGVPRGLPLCPHGWMAALTIGVRHLKCPLAR